MDVNLSTGNKKANPKSSSRSGAALVAVGILLSRLMGLVRQKIFAYYFGNSDVGDAFYAALKIPNFPQNLLGDGVLSASFIPVYANLLAEGKKEEADRVAGIIGSVLAILVTLIVAVGVLATPFLIDLIAPGFHGAKRDLTIHLVQIFFPGTGFLVMSAWCLGILNSHRKFFLSYAAPVIWNVAIIFALLIFGGRGIPEELVVQTAWGVFIGSVLQFLIQVPTVFRCAPDLKFKPVLANVHVRTIFRNFTPVVTARGVVQLSAYIDNILASLLPSGAVSALAYAQSLYMLPISLFGMSVSAAELPAMSGATGTPEEVAAYLRKRVVAGFRQIAFFVIPSVVGFWALGDVMIDGLYRGGEFTYDNTLYVWGVLAGSTIGLLAGTVGRLYSSTFYSLKDTRTPLKFAIVRVVLTTVLGYLFGLKLPQMLGIPAWGTAGLTASAGLAGWIEFLFLRHALRARIGAMKVPMTFLVKAWTSAGLAGAAGWGIKVLVGHDHALMNLVFVLVPYGLIYFALTAVMGLDESKRFVQKLLRFF
jgi:putative peptidoglycan lipid II flippase